MTDPAAFYFGAERTEGLLFVIIGLLAVEVAYTCWRRSGSQAAKGGAVVLLLVAALQLVVGATLFVRSPHDLARVNRAVEVHRPHIHLHEVPRMQQVMSYFRIYRWIEIVLLLLGLCAAIWARQGSWLRGAGAGIVPQAGVMLILDGLAEQRGRAYLVWLQTL